MSEAVTVQVSLMMMTATVFEESLAKNAHTHTHTDTVSVIFLKIKQREPPLRSRCSLAAKATYLPSLLTVLHFLT